MRASDRFARSSNGLIFGLLLSAAVRNTSLNASTAGLAWYSRTWVAPSNSFA